MLFQASARATKRKNGWLGGLSGIKAQVISFKLRGTIVDAASSIPGMRVLSLGLNGRRQWLQKPVHAHMQITACLLKDLLLWVLAYCKLISTLFTYRAEPFPPSSEWQRNFSQCSKASSAVIARTCNQAGAVLSQQRDAARACHRCLAIKGSTAACKLKKFRLNHATAGLKLADFCTAVTNCLRNILQASLHLSAPSSLLAACDRL